MWDVRRSEWARDGEYKAAPSAALHIVKQAHIIATNPPPTNTIFTPPSKHNGQKIRSNMKVKLVLTPFCIQFQWIVDPQPRKIIATVKTQ